MWTEFVDLIRATIFATAHVCSGSLGAGVLLVSAVVRLALLPLTLRMARQAAVAIQIPFLAGLFSAVRSGLGAGVRFGWIADLARPDRLLVIAVAGLSAAAMAVAPAPPQGAQAMTPVIVISALMALWFLSGASSAVALSWGAGSAVSALQNWMLRREARLAAA